MIPHPAVVFGLDAVTVRQLIVAGIAVCVVSVALGVAGAAGLVYLVSLI